MTIELQKETHDQLVRSIKRYFAENTESEIGDLKAAMLLEFCVKEIGPSIYNQAIADAQTFFQASQLNLRGCGTKRSSITGSGSIRAVPETTDVPTAGCSLR